MKELKLKKGNLFVYIALLVFAVAAMVVSRNIAAKGSVVADDVISSSGQDTLRVGIQLSPLGISTSADTLGGFYYDMIREIASREGLILDIDAFSQVSTALTRLDAGRYDIVIADIPATSDLMKRYLFTDPVYADREVLVQLKDSLTGEPPITSQMMLRGDTVYISARSPFLSRIRNLSHELGDTIYVVQDPEYGTEQLMILTALGEVKNVVVNEQVAKVIAKDYPQLDLSLSLSFNQFQSWAVSQRDSVLCDSLNRYIARFKASKDFEKLISRYFNEKPFM